METARQRRSQKIGEFRFNREKYRTRPPSNGRTGIALIRKSDALQCSTYRAISEFAGSGRARISTERKRFAVGPAAPQKTSSWGDRIRSSFGIAQMPKGRRVTDSMGQWQIRKARRCPVSCSAADDQSKSDCHQVRRSKKGSRSKRNVVG